MALDAVFAKSPRYITETELARPLSCVLSQTAVLPQSVPNRGAGWPHHGRPSGFWLTVASWPTFVVSPGKPCAGPGSAYLPFFSNCRPAPPFQDGWRPSLWLWLSMYSTGINERGYTKTRPTHCCTPNLDKTRIFRNTLFLMLEIWDWARDRMSTWLSDVQ